MSDKKNRDQKPVKDHPARQGIDKPQKKRDDSFNESERKRNSVLDTIPPPKREKKDK